MPNILLNDIKVNVDETNTAEVEMEIQASKFNSRFFDGDWAGFSVIRLHLK